MGRREAVTGRAVDHRPEWPPDWNQSDYRRTRQAIPNSLYASEPGLTNDVDGVAAGPDHAFISVTNGLDGLYSIEVNGTGTGPYHLDFSSVAEDGSLTLQTIAGVASVGSKTVYRVQV